MIRTCTAPHRETVLAVTNDGARAYNGVIPADGFHSPCMSREELTHGIAQGIRFYLYEQADGIGGVMGMQNVADVTLIRHACVRTDCQGQGIGASLHHHLRQLTLRPVLMGAWADASWALRFYQHHGFKVVSSHERDRLLKPSGLSLHDRVRPRSSSPISSGEIASHPPRHSHISYGATNHGS